MTSADLQLRHIDLVNDMFTLMGQMREELDSKPVTVSDANSTMKELNRVVASLRNIRSQRVIILSTLHGFIPQLDVAGKLAGMEASLKEIKEDQEVRDRLRIVPSSVGETVNCHQTCADTKAWFSEGRGRKQKRCSGSSNSPPRRRYRGMMIRSCANTVRQEGHPTNAAG